MARPLPEPCVAPRPHGTDRTYRTESTDRTTSSRTDRIQQLLSLRPSGPRRDPGPTPRSSRITRNQRRNSQSSSSSSTSPERGNDDDWGTLQNNDSQSSLSPSILSEPDGDTINAASRDAGADDAHSPFDPPANLLPPEILLNIFSRLSSSHHLLSCMLVSKHWARNSVAMLWHRPLMNKWSNVERVVKAMRNEKRMYSYPNMIKRLNLASVGQHISDGTLLSMSSCNRIERLTLTACTQLSDTSLMPIISGNKNLVALDLTKLHGVSDSTLLTVANNCHRLQGLNVSDCTGLTDVAVCAIAQGCKSLKRLKFTGCRELTSASISMVASNCPNLLEIDLGGLQGIQSSAVADLLLMCKHLRELRLGQCAITNSAFTQRRTIAPPTFEALRVLDLTNCTELTDRAVEHIADTCPRLRNLLLSKCRNLTDRAVHAITKLGKNLHFVHLGHCTRLTDSAITALACACTRIRYIDLACCANLSDESIAQLAAHLPKLKRVGLVKCTGISDRAILDLATFGGRSRARNGLIGGNVLERVHLSYCINLTPLGIHALLNNCPKLTHLSLTGVTPFLTEEIQAFCRKAPPEFNDHQSQMFCVFSGSGVAQLRTYLNQPESRRSLMADRPPGFAGMPDMHIPNPGNVPPFLAAQDGDVDEEDLEDDIVNFNAATQASAHVAASTEITNSNSNTNHAAQGPAGPATYMFQNGGQVSTDHDGILEFYASAPDAAAAIAETAAQQEPHQGIQALDWHEIHHAHQELHTPQPHQGSWADIGIDIGAQQVSPGTNHVIGMMGAAMLSDTAGHGYGASTGMGDGDGDQRMIDRDEWRRSQAPGPA